MYPVRFIQAIQQSCEGTHNNLTWQTSPAQDRYPAGTSELSCGDITIWMPVACMFSMALSG